MVPVLRSYVDVIEKKAVRIPPPLSKTHDLHPRYSDEKPAFGLLKVPMEAVAQVFFGTWTGINRAWPQTCRKGCLDQAKEVQRLVRVGQSDAGH